MLMQQMDREHLYEGVNQGKAVEDMILLRDYRKGHVH